MLSFEHSDFLPKNKQVATFYCLSNNKKS